MREIALDTETTGLLANGGDKITEIGCVEIIDKKITGRTFHAYINPEREVSDRASEISGLTYEFLKKYKIFKDVYQDFMNFIEGDRLIIHNSAFDIGFLNAEAFAIGGVPLQKNRVVDTLSMARQKYPGAQATLDALCRRFSVDTTLRTKHGALIDAELLAQVYINMSVEFNQKDIFSLDYQTDSSQLIIESRKTIDMREFNNSEEDLLKHSEFLKKLKNPMWENFSKD